MDRCEHTDVDGADAPSDRAEAHRWRLVAAIARAAASGVDDSSALAGAAADVIARELGDAAVVILTEPSSGGGPVAVGAHRKPVAAVMLDELLATATPADLLQFAQDVSLTGETVSTSMPARTGSWGDLAYRHYTAVEGLTMSAFASVKIRDDTLGVVACTRDVGSAAYAPPDLDAIAAAADILGVFVDAARVRGRQGSLDRQRQIAFDTAPIGMIVLDARGWITHVNPAGSQIFGRGPGELLGRSWEEFSPPEDITQGRLDAERMLAGETHAVTRTTAVVQPDGLLRRIRSSTVLVRRDDGSPESYHAQFADVTDLLAAQQEITGLAEQRRILLAQLVAAEQAERERIAHNLHDEPVQLLAAAQLRLQSLTGPAGVAAPADFDVKIGEIAALIAAARDRLRETLRGLDPPTSLSNSMGTAIRAAAVDLFDGSATEVAVIGDIAELPREVSAVLHRAAREALSNALRHAAAASVKVELEDTGLGVVVRVSDDGVGLPVPVHDRPGHLGLRAMSNRVEALGGSCSIERANSGGTVVTIRLPHVPPRIPGTGATVDETTAAG